jgi:hypothetical protein
MKHVSALEPTILEFAVSLTVVWRLLLSGCQPLRIFICEGKTAVIALKIFDATCKI